MSGLTNLETEKYLKKYLSDNEYPDGPFEFVELNKIKLQIDLWRWEYNFFSLYLDFKKIFADDWTLLRRESKFIC